MLFDIAAMQYLYGAAASANPGDTVYRFEAGEQVWRTLFDTDGTDTIDVSELVRGVRLDLRAAALSEVGPPADTGGPPQRKTLAIGFGTDIENAIGSEAADRISGNALANRLEGRAGKDTLEGGAGDDVLVPGPGDDRVEGGPGVDRVVLDGAFAQFSIRIKGQKVELADLLGGSGSDGRDRLRGVELLAFDDQVVSVEGATASLLAPAEAAPGF
jgi:Ca2+-binding RTX toxin-like protein